MFDELMVMGSSMPNCDMLLVKALRLNPGCDLVRRAAGFSASVAISRERTIKVDRFEFNVLVTDSDIQASNVEAAPKNEDATWLKQLSLVF